MSAPDLTVYVTGQDVVSGDQLNTYEQTCNTYDDLRAFTGTTGLQVFVRGGSAIADGGQGIFYWSSSSTAADNGSTVIAPSGLATGRWLRLTLGTASVISATASGTNAITLTPIASSPSVAAYFNHLMYAFTAANTTNGAVTIGTSLGLKKLYTAGSTSNQAGAGTLTQNVLYVISYNSALDSGSGGFVIVSATSASSTTNFAFAMSNGYLDWAVAASALTVTLKTSTGGTPSATDPVIVYFRDSTATTGTFSAVSVTAATSVTVSSGSTLGTVSTGAFKVWCLALNNAGTVELAVIQTASGTAPAVSIAAINDDVLRTTTAEGGAGGADTGGVFYSTTARSSVPTRILGYGEWGSGLATAGTWSSGPTRAQLYESGLPLPGEVVQSAYSEDGAVATGVTAIPIDDTIPQNTEGDQYMSKAITPTMASNWLDIHAKLLLSNTTAVWGMTIALFQDTTADALAADSEFRTATTHMCNPEIDHRMRAAVTTSTTFKVRAGENTAAGTTTFNGQSGARRFGGVANSVLKIEEIMS